MLSLHSNLFGLALGVLLVGPAPAQVTRPEFASSSVHAVPWQNPQSSSASRSGLCDVDGDALPDLVAVYGGKLQVALSVGYRKSYQPRSTLSVSDMAVVAGEIYTVGDTLRVWSYDADEGVDAWSSAELETCGSPWLGAQRLVGMELSSGGRGFVGLNAARNTVLFRLGVVSTSPTFAVSLGVTVHEIALVDDGSAVPTAIAVTTNHAYRVRPSGAVLIATFPSALQEVYLASPRAATGGQKLAAIVSFVGSSLQTLLVYDLATGFEEPEPLPTIAARSLVALDFDSDGDEDLVALHDTSVSDDLRILTLRNRLGESGALQSYSLFDGELISTGTLGSNGPGPAALSVGDVTNDGDLDLVVSAGAGAELRVMENRRIDDTKMQLVVLPPGVFEAQNVDLVYDYVGGGLAGPFDVNFAYSGPGPNPWENATHFEVRMWRDVEPDPFAGCSAPILLDPTATAAVDNFAFVDGKLNIELAFPSVPDPANYDDPYSSYLVLDLTPLVLDGAGVEVSRGPMRHFALTLTRDALCCLVECVPEQDPPSPPYSYTVGAGNTRTEIGGIVPVDVPPDFEGNDPPKPSTKP